VCYIKHKYNYFSCAADLEQQLEMRQGLPLSGDFSYFIKTHVNKLGNLLLNTLSIETDQRKLFLVSLWASPSAWLDCVGASISPCWSAEIKQDITQSYCSWLG